MEERKYLDWRQVELLTKGKDAPPPTPRTLHDRYGFQVWLDYIEEAEEAHRRNPGETKEFAWPGGKLPPVHIDQYTFVEAFDYIEWAKREPGDLVLYDFRNSYMFTRRRAQAEVQKAMAKETQRAQYAGTSLTYR